MYSRIDKPACIGKILLKPIFAERNHKAIFEGNIGAITFDEKLWFIIKLANQEVVEMFYAEPNQHGWSASEAHAKSYLNRFNPVNPFELDNIP